LYIVGGHYHGPILSDNSGFFGAACSATTRSAAAVLPATLPDNECIDLAAAVSHTGQSGTGNRNGSRALSICSDPGSPHAGASHWTAQHNRATSVGCAFYESAYCCKITSIKVSETVTIKIMAVCAGLERIDAA
jgi:hypothetical protein